ncbi:MAG: hypothetical protein ACRD1H_18410 [Vicinamibacterales bacterium]
MVAHHAVLKRRNLLDRLVWVVSSPDSSDVRLGGHVHILQCVRHNQNWSSYTHGPIGENDSITVVGVEIIKLSQQMR